MIELGKVQTLTVQREKDFGVYMGEPGDEKRAVLLPRKQVPEGTKVGDSLEVFVYKDSEDCHFRKAQASGRRDGSADC